MKMDNIFTLLFLGILAVAVTAVIILPAKSGHHRNTKAAKCKSRLKQIGTIVAMYFTDGGSTAYPKDPSVLEIDEVILHTDKTSSWEETCINSPYFFFPNENHTYSGSPKIPLATNWEPLREKPYFQIVWEDGHVSVLTPEEHEKMINSSPHGKKIKKLYDESNKHNPVFK